MINNYTRKKPPQIEGSSSVNQDVLKNDVTTLIDKKTEENTIKTGDFDELSRVAVVWARGGTTTLGAAIGDDPLQFVVCKKSGRIGTNVLEAPSLSAIDEYLQGDVSAAADTGRGLFDIDLPVVGSGA